ncbi:MAG TPA: M48 family metalloprotease [Rhodocyclaceae bacterium]|nr:M48 family metalloprotease [Rhodocyclaceae bacterium]
MLQPSSAQFANTLPDLGDPAQADLSPAQERRIGELAMREIREDFSYVDDADIEDYINVLGSRLVAASGLRGQDFTFFVLRDPTINAFAMPGGYVGIHTGLLAVTQSESELASVLSHEIGHIEQRHMARSLAKQGNATATMLASLLVAVLGAHGNSQVPEAAIMAGQAAAIQGQLSYSRDFEREADRVGFQTLEAAGFDVRAMPTFFERLQRASQLNEGNAPAYLQTHPLTLERIADMQGRAYASKYKQVVDSTEFTLVRAKLNAEQGTPRDAIARITASNDSRPQDAAAKRYALTRVYLRDHKPAEAGKALASLRELKLNSPMIETLAADVATAQGHPLDAASICHNAQSRYPRSRALVDCEVLAYLDGGKPDQALALLNDQIAQNPQDDRLYAFQARSYQALGKPTQQYRAQAEVYALRGNLLAAIDQLQLAQHSGGGDYYEQSAIDARLRELRAKQKEDAKDNRGGRQGYAG